MPCPRSLRTSSRLVLAEADIAEVDRDHQWLLDWAIIRPALVSASFCRQTQALNLRVVVNELGGCKSARDVNAVVVPTKHEILVEKEVLNVAVRGEIRWKAYAEPAPDLTIFRPGFDLLSFDAGHFEKEGRGQVGPEGISIEVCPMERIPRRCLLVAFEGLTRVRPFSHHFAVSGFDCDPVGGEGRSLIGRTKGRYRCPFLVQRYVEFRCEMIRSQITALYDRKLTKRLRLRLSLLR